MSLPPTFEATLASARMLTPGVRELRFSRSDRSPFHFVAGQWVSLLLPLSAPDGAPELRRSYSVASPPDGSEAFELAVTRVGGGPGSAYLHGLPVGETLRVVGPQGFFTRPTEKTGPSLFVATGTGVTPLRSMLRAAVGENEVRPLWLLFGARSEADILYADEMAVLAREHRNVRFIPTLSQGSASWAGRRGYVQAHVRELWQGLVDANTGTPHVYVCGLERMVSAVRALVRKEMGVPREQVHSERYD